MIVVDASAVVEYLRGDEAGEAARAWLEAEEGAVHAPALMDVEVAQVLRRLVMLGEMDAGRGGASIEILAEMPVSRQPILPLLPRMWELRHGVTPYDAAYLALAEALGCPLVTFDRALARVPGRRADVRLLVA